MTEVKAIETLYNGYRFRSRSEARYAVFFDAIGIRYLYEHEGYDLGDGIFYLPDFYLPDANQFFEVKADIENISKKDIEKIIRLANKTGKYVIVGDSYFHLTGHKPNQFNEKLNFSMENTHLVRCNSCKTLYFINELFSYTCTSCGFHDGGRTFEYISGANGCLDYCKNEYASAIAKAKQARFEHGETPTVNVIQNNYQNNDTAQKYDDAEAKAAIFVHNNLCGMTDYKDYSIGGEFNLCNLEVLKPTVKEWLIECGDGDLFDYMPWKVIQDGFRNARYKKIIELRKDGWHDYAIQRYYHFSDKMMRTPDETIFRLLNE